MLCDIGLVALHARFIQAGSPRGKLQLMTSQDGRMEQVCGRGHGPLLRRGRLPWSGARMGGVVRADHGRD